MSAKNNTDEKTSDEKTSLVEENKICPLCANSGKFVTSQVVKDTCKDDVEINLLSNYYECTSDTCSVKYFSGCEIILKDRLKKD